jgi:hypothetical protein
MVNVAVLGETLLCNVSPRTATASLRLCVPPLNRFHLFCVLLAHGKKRTEPRATALPWGVLVFSTKSKNANTPPEWAGTLLRACFAVRKQSPPQVKVVEGAEMQRYK